MSLFPISFRKFVSKVLLNPAVWISWLIVALFFLLDFPIISVILIFILIVSFFNFLPYYLIKGKESKIIFPQENSVGCSGHILVLGGGHIPDPEIVYEQQLSTNSLRRVLEGVRLFKKNSNSLLIMFGKSLKVGHPSQAEIQLEVAITMGVHENKIKVIAEPSNTEEEALFYHKNFGNHGKTIYLVTKALHIERASFIFSHLGYKIIPAPSYFVYRNFQPTISWLLIPDFKLIVCFGEYLKEFVGFRFLKFQYNLGLESNLSNTMNNKSLIRRSSFEILNK